MSPPPATGRFARHEALEGVGPSGQHRIASARILVVGIGGLGAPAALYLAAAGVGRLTLVDFARVDLPDLQRQVLYGEADLGQHKAAAAAAHLVRMHPALEVHGHAGTFDPDLVAGHDVVLDATDEPGSRALVQQACLAAGVPLVWAAVEAWDAQATTVAPGGPCTDCILPPRRDGPSCADIGVFGPLAGQVGCMMAGEALRVALGRPSWVGRLLVLDGRDSTSHVVSFARRASCPTCSGAAK